MILFNKKEKLITIFLFGGFYITQLSHVKFMNEYAHHTKKEAALFLGQPLFN